MISEEDFQQRARNREFTVPTFFVHNCFSSLFHGMLNWITDEFYPRFKYKIVTTYDKAVEFFMQKQRVVDGQVQTNVVPCVTLDPILDFSNEERAGRFLWMFEHLDGKTGANLFSSINLRDQGVSIVPIFTRYQGTVELTFWFSSVYELIDFRVKLIQYCGGFGRWIRPKFFWTHLILPKQLVEFEGPDGKLDWSHTNRQVIILETTNTKEYAYPFLLNAIWKLDSFNDGSTKMGGDQLSEWKLTASFTWEAMIPTFMRVLNYDFAEISINTGMSTGQTYTSQPLVSGFKLLSKISSYNGLTRFIKKYPIYNIVDDGATPLIKWDDEQCFSYPQMYNTKNHYVVGKILLMKKLKKLSDIKDFNSILVFEKFKDEYIPYLRRCKGAISRDDDTSSDFYSFCTNLEMSFICNIKDDTMYDAISKLHNKVVTFDPIGQMIYSGSREIKRYESTDDVNKFVFNNNLLKIINRQNMLDEVSKDAYVLPVGTKVSVEDTEQILATIEDPSIRKYSLPMIVGESNQQYVAFSLNDVRLQEKQYTIENQTDVVISDSVQLKSGDVLKFIRKNNTVTRKTVPLINYSMTKTDEREYYTKKKLIEIKIDDDVDLDTIVCCSYNGLMTIDNDYIIDKENKTITFNMEPMRDRVIQIFGIRNE